MSPSLVYCPPLSISFSIISLFLSNLDIFREVSQCGAQKLGCETENNNSFVEFVESLCKVKRNWKCLKSSIQLEEVTNNGFSFDWGRSAKDIIGF